MNRDEEVSQREVERVNPNRLKQSVSHRLAMAISNSHTIKKFSLKKINILAAVGYIMPFVFLALSLAKLFVAEGTATTLTMASAWILNIGYIPLGFLAGLVASANTFESCHTQLGEAENKAKKYMLSFRLFDFFEIIQWIFVAAIFASLVVMTISFTNGNNYFFSLSQTFGTFSVMLSSVSRVVENGWLSYRRSQINEIVDIEKKAETVRLNNANAQLQTQLNEVTSSFNTMKNFISHELNEYGKPIIDFKSFEKWGKKGLTMAHLQAIEQDEPSKNIASKVITDLIEKGKLEITEGFNLTRAKRKLFEILYEKKWLDEIPPEAILQLADNAIHRNRLKNRHVIDAITNNLLDPITAVQLQPYHVEELEKQNTTVFLLLRRDVIKLKNFSKLTFDELVQVNQLKADRAEDVMQVFKLDDFIKLLPVKKQAINSDAMLTFIMAKQLKSQLANINNEEDLKHFIDTNQPQPSTSQKLKL